MVFALASPLRVVALLMSLKAATLSRLSDERFSDLAVMISSAPEVVQLQVEIHAHLVEMPLLKGFGTYPIALPAELGGEQGTETVPPEPHRLTADVDTSLVDRVLRGTSRTSSLRA